MHHSIGGSDPMRTTTASTVILALALTLAGCRTVPIPPPTTIDVPPGLSLQAVEVAVMAGINNGTSPATYDPTRELPQADFDAMLDRDFVVLARAGGWFPEPRRDGVRYASVDTRGHHLLVGIHLDTKQIRIELVESRDLLQAHGRIHKAAVTWIGNLETRIRRELDRMEVRIQLRREPPAAAGKP
jgi:hypothetical protein